MSLANYHSGADPGFVWGGGGGGKSMCAHGDHEHKARSPLRPGSMRAPLKGLGSSRAFDALYYRDI